MYTYSKEVYYKLNIIQGQRNLDKYSRKTLQNYAKLLETTRNHVKPRKTLQNSMNLHETKRNHAKPRKTTQNHV